MGNLRARNGLKLTGDASVPRGSRSDYCFSGLRKVCARATCSFFFMVMEKLVDIVHFLHLEIHKASGRSDNGESQEPTKQRNRLGPAGLALHYANIISQIDTLTGMGRGYDYSPSPPGDYRRSG